MTRRRRNAYNDTSKKDVELRMRKGLLAFVGPGLGNGATTCQGSQIPGPDLHKGRETD